MLELSQYIDLLPDPQDTIKKLDLHIVGQDEAKKNLSIMLLVRALVRLQKNGKIPKDMEIQKSNLLLIGPTGTGKTSLIKALSEVSGIPILIKDVTGITSAGYIGGKVEDVLIEYVNNIDAHMSDIYKNILINNDYHSADDFRHDLFMDSIETGIIYLDEFDKLRMKHSGGIDVTGDTVQNELLKMLEGSTLSLTHQHGHGSTTPRSGIKELNTKYITFICGGAFAGLVDIIQARLAQTKMIGFNAKPMGLNVDRNYNELLRNLKTEDLINYGFKAEVLGRLPLKARLDELTLKTMVQIITEPKDAIYKRYKEFFRLFNIDLNIEKKAIDEISQKALDLKMGARSLHQIFNTLFLDDLANIFVLQGTKLNLTKKDVLKRLS